jgi:hypothetical protein
VQLHIVDAPLRQKLFRVEGARPESIVPPESQEKWIPGLRLASHPGMTAGDGIFLHQPYNTPFR